MKLIEKSSHTPAITTATAVKAAFTSLGVKRVAIATPSSRDRPLREGTHGANGISRHCDARIP